MCMVMRGFTGAPTFTPLQVRIFVNYDPKTRAPICLNPAAVRTVLPYYELRTKLGLEGKTAEQIAAGVEAAYAKGEIPKRTEVSFAYMWSADQVLGPAGHWHPHIMVYLPYYENSMLGNNDPGKPSSSHRRRCRNAICRWSYPGGRQTSQKGTAITDSERAFWGRFLCWRLLPSMMELLRIVTHESGTKICIKNHADASIDRRGRQNHGHRKALEPNSSQLLEVS